MIHESIDPKNDTRVLINLNQVAHITMRPDQEHINVQFGSGCLRLNCGSREAAQNEYASVKQRMQGASTNDRSADNEFGTVLSIDTARNDR